MKKDSKKNKLFLLLILVLVVTIGYAALATTLKINGNTIVKGLNWSIYWDNVQVKTGSVTGANVTTTPTTVGTTTTEIDFAVILPEPGDFYEFEVDAVNAGTIDAMIKDNGIITKAYSDANYTTEVQLPDVVRYTVTYADGTEIEDNHLLAKKSGNTPTRETYKVRVEYRNDEEIDPDNLDGANDRQYYLRFEVEYVQADNNAVARNGGNQTSNNQYLTRFDGTYTYTTIGRYEANGNGFVPVEFSNDWTIYLRNDGTKSEVCKVYPNGTVCLAGSETGYYSDFENCTESSSYTCLKGYSKAKVDEMLLKGATDFYFQTDINGEAYGIATFDGTSEWCEVKGDGRVACYNDYGDSDSCYSNDDYGYCD